MSRVPDSQTWGRWRYERSNLTLVLLNDGKWEYEVDLERCNDSAQILDWIVQVSEKAFASPVDVGHLVAALDDLSDGLQEKVCSFGKNHKFDFGSFLRGSGANRTKE